MCRLNRVWTKVTCVVLSLLRQLFCNKTKKFTSGVSSCGDVEQLPRKNTTEERKVVKPKEKPRFEPPNIPGVRGTKNSPKRKNSSPNEEKSPPLSQPELICRENTSFRNWEVILSADENSVEEVRFEGGEKLEPSNQGEYKITSLRGRLIVTYRDSRELNYVTLFEEGKPLIFKLRKNWKGEGLRVSRITSGCFIVIAPSAWERKNRPPVEPFDCIDAEFRGHYWDVLESGGVLDAFVEYSLPSSAPIIKLDGACIFDDSDKGVLFVGKVPILKVPQNITHTRIGEEARGEWKGDNFKPHEQSLSEVFGGREGWFFLRAYDDTKQLDSISFRYLRNLKQIQIDGKEYTQDMVLTPPMDGYSLTEVSFLGADDATISPRLPSESVCRVTPCGILEVPAREEADRISCIISSPEGGNVEITLNLPRIWWRIEFDNTNLGKWRDTPIDMTRQKFQQYAGKGAKIRLSSQRFKSILAGFDDDLVQRYRQSEIALDNFAYHNQIINRLESDAYFNVMWGEKILSIIRVFADPVEIPPPPKKLSISPAFVKRTRCAQNEWRNGRGFSYREIREAGLNEDDEKRIPRDCRRRSLHLINVEKIRKACDV